MKTPTYAWFQGPNDAEPFIARVLDNTTNPKSWRIDNHDKTYFLALEETFIREATKEEAQSHINRINKLNSLINKNDMKLHEVTEVTEKPYFRKMRVEGGFMYSFWISEKDDYSDDWIFVPVNKMNIQEAVEKLQSTLKEDEEYREVWKANIAMSFVDEWNTNEIFQQSEQQYSDVHKLANKAADRLLDILARGRINTEESSAKLIAVLLEACNMAQKEIEKGTADQLTVNVLIDAIKKATE